MPFSLNNRCPSVILLVVPDTAAGVYPGESYHLPGTGQPLRLPHMAVLCSGVGHLALGSPSAFPALSVARSRVHVPASVCLGQASICCYGEPELQHEGDVSKDICEFSPFTQSACLAWPRGTPELR